MYIVRFNCVSITLSDPNVNTWSYSGSKYIVIKIEVNLKRL